MTDLQKLEDDVLAAIAGAATEQALEEVRVGALGKKGSISQVMKGLGKMSPEERKEMGPKLNGLKNKVADAIAQAKSALHEAALDARLKSETIDITQPARATPISEGRIHPISQVMDEITAIFADLGFGVEEGPDIETDHYNLSAAHGSNIMS